MNTEPIKIPQEHLELWKECFYYLKRQRNWLIEETQKYPMCIEWDGFYTCVCGQVEIDCSSGPADPMFEEHTSPYTNLYCTLKELLQEMVLNGKWYCCKNCSKSILAYNDDEFGNKNKYCKKCTFQAYEQAWYSSRDYCNSLRRHPQSTHISFL